jgi:cellulose synthase/poly-beta-1,6-N-acetylglucosamine synthase-like glycosyltransferase
LEHIDFIEISSWLFLTYAFLISSGYLFAAIFSFLQIKSYKNTYSLPHEEVALLQSASLPGISILAPAYNEEISIVANVKSMLTLSYPNYEIVIINDGSTDATLQQLIDTYEMMPVDHIPINDLDTKEIKAIYKSRHKSFGKLTVIDKENGGKSDALNAGINICLNEIICCIDVDCVLEHDALLKLVKPFLNNDKKVIASGGIIRIANSCVVEDGKITEICLPDKFIARVQILEYFRAFLMGRMAWARLDGLLLISGAFGMFDKKTVLEAGGYSTKTVGEDMELLVRMRRMMQERKEEYIVGFVPNPLCWTEVPQTLKVLYRQRNRWTRGTIETLWTHRKMLFNPKYKVLGLLSTPYWLFFEWMAPLIEFIGFVFIIVLVALGELHWIVFLSFFLVAYTFSVLYSITAIFFEEYSFQQYKKPKDILVLIGTALIEPLFYHPYVMWCSVRGNYDLITGKRNWGVMHRRGFKKK